MTNPRPSIDLGDLDLGDANADWLRTVQRTHDQAPAEANQAERDADAARRAIKQDTVVEDAQQ